jgi:RNA polymerase sigma-70 factor (ECF subfamily)
MAVTQRRENTPRAGISQPTGAGNTDLENVWIARARSGDVGAFESIFRSYYERLCLFAEGYVDSRDQAEDLVADVFVRMWQGREKCFGCESIRSYLYVSVRNQAMKLHRHRKVVDRLRQRIHAGGPVPGMSSSRDDPAANTAANELARAVERAVASLPERSRQTYLLHRQHGMSYAEIADVMEISVKTVENHLARAVAALRRTLAEWES